jgi:hypothetical protein
VLDPAVAGYRSTFKLRNFLTDVAFANPEVNELQKLERYKHAIRCLPIRFVTRGSVTCSSALHGHHAGQSTQLH